MWKGLGAAIAATMLAGCATVARGTTEQIAFDSLPTGAEVRIVATHMAATPDSGGTATNLGCVTPCTVQVKRVDKLAVTVTKPGYISESFGIAPQATAEGVATSVLGNGLLIGGVVGLVVDGASGASLDKCPNPIRIALRPESPPARKRGDLAATAQPAFGYDPVEACKVQIAERQKAAEAIAAKNENSISN